MINPIHLQLSNIVMRKLIALLTGIFIFTSTFSQTWFDLGLKGGAGTSILINQNIWDDRDYNHRISPAHCFGIKAGINLSENHEITFDVLYNQFNQSFLYNQFDSLNNSSALLGSKITYNSMSYLLMYRFNKEGRYSEIGSSIETILNCSTEDDNNLAPSISNNDLTRSFPCLVAGFGAYFMGTDNFGITTGLRISYGFSDIISNSGKNLLLPNFKNYTTYTPSHPLSIQFIIEANFDFAYVAKAQCSRRKLILF